MTKLFIVRGNEWTVQPSPQPVRIVRALPFYLLLVGRSCGLIGLINHVIRPIQGLRLADIVWDWFFIYFRLFTGISQWLSLLHVHTHFIGSYLSTFLSVGPYISICINLPISLSISFNIHWFISIVFSVTTSFVSVCWWKIFYLCLYQNIYFYLSGSVTFYLTFSVSSYISIFATLHHSIFFNNFFILFLLCRFYVSLSLCIILYFFLCQNVYISSTFSFSQSISVRLFFSSAIHYSSLPLSLSLILYFQATTGPCFFLSVLFAKANISTSRSTHTFLLVLSFS